MFQTFPSDPVHALNAFYQLVGGYITQGMSAVVMMAIFIGLVIVFTKPVFLVALFRRVVWLGVVGIVVVLIFAHFAGKF